MAGAGQIRAGSAFVELAADGTKLNAGLAAAAARVQQWGASITRVGAAMAAPLLGVANALSSAAFSAAGAAVRGFAGQMVTASSDFELFRVSLNNLYGGVEAGGAAFEAFKQFALVTPFDLKGVVSSARQLRIVGFEAEEVIPILTRAGDIMSSVGGDTAGMQTFIEVLAAMRTKAAVSALEMRRLAVMGIPGWEALASHMGKTVAEVRNLSRAGAIGGETGIAALLKLADDPRFRDGMKRVQGSFAILRSNLHDLFEQLAVEVGKPLFDGLKDGIRGVNDYLLSDAGKQWAAQFRDAVGSGVVAFGQLAGWAVLYRREIGTAVAVTAGLGVGLMAVGTAVSVFGAALAVVSAGLGAVLAGVGLLLTPIGMVAAGLAAAAAGWLAFTDEGKATVADAKSVWSNLAATMKGSWASVVNALRSGDLELAFKIVAKSLELEWVRTMGVLEARWRSIVQSIDDAYRRVVGFSIPTSAAQAGSQVTAMIPQTPVRRAGPLTRLLRAGFSFLDMGGGTARGMDDMVRDQDRRADAARAASRPTSGLGFLGSALGVLDGGGAGAFLGQLHDALKEAGNPRAAEVFRLLKELEVLRKTATAKPAVHPETPGLTREGDLLRMPKALADDIALDVARRSAMTMGAFQTGGSAAFMRFGGQESGVEKQVKGLRDDVKELRREVRDGMEGE